MSKRKFAKTQLATSLSLILGVTISTPVLAQERDDQEHDCGRDQDRALRFGLRFVFAFVRKRIAFG